MENSFVKKIKKEGLQIPNYNKENIIDVVRLVYNYCGMNYKETSSMKKLKQYIINKKHIVLILVDGMGSDLLNKMPNKGLFYNNKKTDIQTVFPTATGCVLTSVATAKYPSSTGIFGWYGYNKILDLNYYTLLTKERKSNDDLKINLKKIFKHQGVLNNLKRKTNVIQPNHLLNSQYTRFFFSDEIRKGYSDYDEMIELIKKDINSEESTFTYLYIPFVDTLEHQNSPYSEIVYDEVSKIEKSIQKLMPLSHDTEIIVIADHGQIPVNELVYMDLNKYDKYFYAYPAIDTGTSTFYIKKGMEKQFEKEFRKDFDDKLLLFRKEDFIENKMFGKRMTKYANDSLGEYISLCKKNKAFYSDYKEANVSIKGNHTGLSSEELIIPLIVLNNNELNNI